MAKTIAMFNGAGLSRKNGKLKARVFSGMVEKRLYRLKRDGQTAIELFELPRKMTKLQAAKWLMGKFKSGPKHEAAAAILERNADTTKPAPKKASKPAKKAVARKASKPAHKATPAPAQTESVPAAA